MIHPMTALSRHVHTGLSFARHSRLAARELSSWRRATGSPQHTTIMPKGDVHVLKRIDKADRRADKATKRLMNALARTKRNKRKAAPTAVTRPTWPVLSFAEDTHIIPHPNLQAVSRRLKRKKVDKRRIFSMGEILEGFETVVRLLVVPKLPCATTQTLAAVAAKDEAVTYAISPERVLLFYTRSKEDSILTGPSSSTHVFLRKVILGGDHAVFYASAEEMRGSMQPPRAFNLDKEVYGRIQRSVAAMVGAQMPAAC